MNRWNKSWSHDTARYVGISTTTIERWKTQREPCESESETEVKQMVRMTQPGCNSWSYFDGLRPTVFNG